MCNISLLIKNIQLNWFLLLKPHHIYWSFFLYFQSHRLLNSTIRALRLSPVTFPRPSRARAMYYLRGHHLPGGCTIYYYLLWIVTPFGAKWLTRHFTLYSLKPKQTVRQCHFVFHISRWPVSWNLTWVKPHLVIKSFSSCIKNLIQRVTNVKFSTPWYHFILESAHINVNLSSTWTFFIFAAQDLNTNRIPYQLEDEERRMYPEELQK